LVGQLQTRAGIDIEGDVDAVLFGPLDFIVVPGDRGDPAVET
jgi:hypothetical protein